MPRKWGPVSPNTTNKRAGCEESRGMRARLALSFLSHSRSVLVEKG